MLANPEFDGGIPRQKDWAKEDVSRADGRKQYATPENDVTHVSHFVCTPRSLQGVYGGTSTFALRDVQLNRHKNRNMQWSLWESLLSNRPPNYEQQRRLVLWFITELISRRGKDMYSASYEELIIYKTIYRC